MGSLRSVSHAAPPQPQGQGRQQKQKEGEKPSNRRAKDREWCPDQDFKGLTLISWELHGKRRRKWTQKATSLNTYFNENLGDIMESIDVGWAVHILLSITDFSIPFPEGIGN